MGAYEGAGTSNKSGRKNALRSAKLAGKVGKRDRTTKNGSPEERGQLKADKKKFADEKRITRGGTKKGAKK